MIRKLFIGLAFAVAIVGCEKVHAEVAVPEPTGFLTDLTGTIPSQSVGALEIKNKAIELQQSPATLTVVMTLIVPTTDGEGVSDFAQRVAEAWHPGSKSEERGVVLVISKGDKSWAIKTSREVSGTLTDYNAKHLLSQMGQYLKGHKGDFAGAVVLFYSEIPQYLKAPPLPEPVASSASVVDATAAPEDDGISGWIWFSLFGLFAVSGLLLLRHWFKQQEAKAQRQAEAEAEIVSRIRQRNQEQQEAAREARNTNMYSSQPHREAPVRKPSPVPPPIDKSELDRRRQADLLAEQTRKRQEQERRERDAQRRREREAEAARQRRRDDDDDSPATDFAASILAGALAGSMSSRSRSEPEPERESRTTYSAPEPEPDRGGNTESYDGGGASGTFGD